MEELAIVFAVCGAGTLVKGFLRILDTLDR